MAPGLPRPHSQPSLVRSRPRRAHHLNGLAGRSANWFGRLAHGSGGRSDIDVRSARRTARLDPMEPLSLIALGLFALVFGLVSRKVDGSDFSPTLLFTLGGVLMGPVGLGIVILEPGDLHTLGEWTSGSAFASPTSSRSLRPRPRRGSCSVTPTTATPPTCHFTRR